MDIQSKTTTQAAFRLLYELIRLSMVIGLSTVTFGYLLPTSLAIANDRRDQLSVFLVNLLAGWTVVGWVVAFLWARKKQPKPTPDVEAV